MILDVSETAFGWLVGLIRDQWKIWVEEGVGHPFSEGVFRCKLLLWAESQLNAYFWR